ncbi:hypothetical protein [Saccharopolyspora sp. NPDC050642]|uniref:hypothetical protein n=1 Tax=Saccharopolyspora sp. NPDC050642 TaxID=3157099 RepID=UPI0033C2F91D
MERKVGMDDAERRRFLAALLEFCAEHRVEPDELLENWLKYPELTVRRTLAPEEARPVANIPVESFLIHNGVNIFGDLVCLPGRPEDLRDQGARFVG